jgi:antibiotic biosynthesis monooxygenase (ABM) superfamily enzyme
MSLSVAITRRVRAGHEAEFQQELRQFFQDSFQQASVLGASMIVPGPGDDFREYGILRTFANEADRDAFYRSPLFQEWEQRVRRLTEGEAEHHELHGLEAWFRTGQNPPPRWKMAAATLAGVYPTSLLLGETVAPFIHGLPLLLRGLVFASVMVALLTWVVMPLVTRLLHPWLHPKTHTSQ